MARPASDISLRIVHAARQLFLRDGVDGASLREIAKSAGTNIGMVYYYFKTKDDLFLAVVEEVYAVIVADLGRTLQEQAPPDARIAQLYARVAAMSEAEFQVVRLIMREALVSSTRLQKLGARFQAGHLPMVTSLLRQSIALEQIRTDQNPLGIMAATLALGLVPQILLRLLGASELPIAKQLPTGPEAASVMLKLLLTGIAGPKLGA